MTADGEEDAQPRSVAVTGSGPVAVGGDVTISGSVAAGRDVIIERLTVIADDGAPFGDAATRPGGATDVCPYPGIQAFAADQRTYFFGRDRDRKALHDLLDRARFVAVIGGSGSGKSSLLAAGVVPDFLEAESRRGVQWSVTTLRPGVRPASGLEQLRQRARPTDAPVLLVVDQLEEAFGRSVDVGERDRFLDALVALAGDPGGATKVLVALRSDFYPNLDLHRPTADAVAANQHRLLPLDEEALRDVIVLPAEKVGLRVEPALVEHVIADVEPGANQLPLLAYAMRETWRRRRNGWLTLAGYVESGGVGEALENGARSVWQALSADQRATTRRIFLRMTSVGPGRPATRQRATVDSLVTDVDDLGSVLDVLERFTRERLVVADVDEGDHVTVDIAHEALLREWSVLCDWLDDDVEAQRLQRDLAQAAAVWHDAGGERAGLLGGRRLQAVHDAHRAGLLTLNDTERAFVEASTTAASRDRRRSALLVVLPIVLAVAIGVVALVIVQQRRTAEQKTVADALQLAAGARSLTSTRRDTAALLAVAALRTDDNPTTLGALVDAVSVPDGPLAFVTIAGARATALSSTLREDGTLVVGASDGSLRFVSSAGEEADRVGTGLSSVSAVDVAPDGTIVVGGSSGDVAVLVPGRRDAIVLTGPATPIRSVALDVAGRIVVAGTDRGEIWRWPLDPTAGSLPMVPLDSGLRALVILGGGDSSGGGGSSQLVAATDDGRVVLVDVDSGATELDTDGVVSPQGRVALAALPDRTLLVLDRSGIRELGPERQSSSDPTPGLTAMATTPDGSRLLVGTESGEVQTWTLDPRPIRVGAGRAGLAGPVKAVASDGTTVAALDEAGRLVAWDVQERRSPGMSERLDQGSGVVAVAQGPGGHIASGGLDGVVRITDAEGRTRVLAEVQTPVRGLAWIGATEVVIGAQDGSVRAVDTSAAASRQLAPPSGDPIVAVASNAGGVLAFATTGGRVTIIAGDRITELRTTGAPVESLALAPEGDAVAVGTGSPADDVRLWELDAPDEPRVLAGHTLKVTSVAFSPSGDLLASGSDDWEIHLWSRRTGDDVGVLRGHTDMVQSLVFGADGTLLASGSEDFTVRVWDVARLRQVGQPWRWVEGPVRALALSADGRSIVAANGTAVVEWSFGEEGWIDRACALAGRELSTEEWEQLAPSLTPHDLCDREAP